MIRQKNMQLWMRTQALHTKSAHLTRLWGASHVHVLWSHAHRAASHLPGPFQEADGAPHEYIPSEVPYSRSRWEIISNLGDSLSGLLSPVDSLASVLGQLEGAIGWGPTFFALGMALRCLSLLPGLYVNRNALRMASISPELNLITQKIRNSRQNNKLNVEDRRVILASYKRQKNQLFAKHGCSMHRNFAQVIMIPFFSSALMAVQRVTYNTESVELATFLWVHDLTMPDPYCVLPLACSLIFLLNIEMNSSLNRGSRAVTAIVMLWVTRVGCLGGMYFCAAQPAAFFIYWLGLSTAGVLQPVLLRMESFRKYFNFPPLSDSIHIAQGNLSEKQKISTLRDYEVVFESKTKSL